MDTRKSAFRTDTTKGDPRIIAEMYEPHTYWPMLEPNFRQLPAKYNIDLEKVRAAARELKAAYGFRAVSVSGSKKKHSYQGLGLTTRPQAQDKLYDSLQVYGEGEQQLDINQVIHSTSERQDPEHRHRVLISEAAFSEVTEACTPVFQEVLAKFDSPLLKVRLLELRAGGVLTSHIDFPYYEGIRLHSVLETNDDCWWEVQGERRQLPADGSFWWMDVGKYHSVWNAGSTPRLVLSVNLSFYRWRDGSPRAGGTMGFMDILDYGLL